MTLLRGLFKHCIIPFASLHNNMFVNDVSLAERSCRKLIYSSSYNADRLTIGNIFNSGSVISIPWSLIVDFLHWQDFTLLCNLLLDYEILHGQDKCHIVYGCFWGFLFVFCKGYKCIKSTCPASPICLNNNVKGSTHSPSPMKGSSCC